MSLQGFTYAPPSQLVVDDINTLLIIYGYKEKKTHHLLFSLVALLPNWCWHQLYETFTASAGERRDFKMNTWESMNVSAVVVLQGAAVAVGAAVAGGAFVAGGAAVGGRADAVVARCWWRPPQWG